MQSRAGEKKRRGCGQGPAAPEDRRSQAQSRGVVGAADLRADRSIRKLIAFVARAVKIICSCSSGGCSSTTGVVARRRACRTLKDWRETPDGHRTASGRWEIQSCIRRGQQALPIGRRGARKASPQDHVSSSPRSSSKQASRQASAVRLRGQGDSTNPTDTTLLADCLSPSARKD